MFPSFQGKTANREERRSRAKARSAVRQRHLRRPRKSANWVGSRRSLIELLEDRTVLSGSTAGALASLPMSFEPNQGQAGSSVQFLAHGPGYSLGLTGTDAVLALQSPATAKGSGSNATTPPTSELHIQLVGANDASTSTALDELPGKTNYLTGSDPSQWHTAVPNFARVQYSNVYPGVDNDLITPVLDDREILTNFTNSTEWDNSHSRTRHPLPHCS